jgi:FkbM family methyltransferase
MAFIPYVAKDRVINEFRFDFHIANETGRSWYDGSPAQWMPEREWCLSQIKAGMTVVDCGAHHGMMSVIFANAVGPGGCVIAYEALPSNADVIRRNAELNHFENIIIRPVGVGEESASVPANFNRSNTVIAQNARVGAPTDVIEVVRLDDDLRADIKVDFLKIDVEGHDLHALRGMSRVLAQRPIVDLELHNFIFEDRIATLKRIVAILVPLDYTWIMLGEIFGEQFDLGRNVDNIELIAKFENPHLFGLP